MAGKNILAIDQGTTGTTVIIFNHEGCPVGKAYSEFTQYFPAPGCVEHDANEIWSVTKRVIAEALAAAGCDAAELACIGITNQRETCLLWERTSGRPVSRAIVWQDRRTAGLCDELKERGLETEWRARTGLLIDPYFSATKLHWMLENFKGCKASAVNGDLAFGTVDSWLLWQLTGGKVHATDYSNASRTLLYNIIDLKWDKDIAGALDIPACVLPEVKSSSGYFGTTDPGVFFGAEVPVSGVAGDQQAALFGQVCFEKGMLKNTYGTGSFLLMNTGDDAVISTERLLTTIAWKLDGRSVEYALEGSIFITGAAVQWLRDGLGIISSAAETEKMASGLQGNDDVYFVPALSGMGAPQWDPYARGLIVGITRGTTRSHIVRAALEAIAYQTRDVADAMAGESGISLTALRADGGAVGNSFLMQFQSDLLGVPVQVPEIAETTALGAAYLAGLGSGVWRSISDIASQWKISREYLPSGDRNIMETLYSRWKMAAARSLRWAE